MQGLFESAAKPACPSSLLHVGVSDLAHDKRHSSETLRAAISAPHEGGPGGLYCRCSSTCEGAHDWRAPQRAEPSLLPKRWALPVSNHSELQTPHVKQTQDPSEGAEAQLHAIAHAISCIQTTRASLPWSPPGHLAVVSAAPGTTILSIVVHGILPLEWRSLAGAA